VGTLPVGHPAAAQRGGLLDGVAVMWRNRTLRAATTAGRFSQLGGGALPLVAAQLAAAHHSTVAAGGLLSACAQRLVGSLGYAHRPLATGQPERAVMLSLVGVAMPLALVPVVPGLVPATVLFGLAGASTSPMTGAMLVSRDREAPPHVHTQVLASGPAGSPKGSHAQPPGHPWPAPSTRYSSMSTEPEAEA
jgi:hypothetical protein